MTALPIFLELQSVHDHLATIHRDLSAFPPDMAKLDTELKEIAKRLETAEKAFSETRLSMASLTKELQQAQKLEDMARSAMKSSTQKVQFTAAIRELDERERQRASVQRPLKEAEARSTQLEKEISELKNKREEIKTAFDGLHEIFLAEHENQVVAKEQLLARKTALESSLGSSDLTRFNKILHARQGKAVVPVENGTCTGCRTKIRGLLLAQLREKSLLSCEYCQRILYIASHS